MAERVGQRIGAVLLTLVFLFSSFALTGFVVWQIRQQNKTKSSDKTSQANLEDQSKDADTANKEQTNDGGKKLAGTKLENFTPITEQVTELQKTDIKEGTGAEVAPGATVTLHYTGALAADGTIFESSKDGGQPVSFPLSNLIKGWQDGVPGMKVGGIRRLVIPYVDAYGEAGSPPKIPEKADLVFDIEVTETK